MSASKFNSLPAELVLNLLSYLPVQSLYSLSLVSRYWRDLILENESSIYHYAALLHNFVPSVDLSLAEACSFHIGNHMKDVDSWKAFSQRCFLLERNWAGQGSAKVKAYNAFADVHRIKVDEHTGLLITTHQDGGLRVRDLESGDLLWELSEDHVRGYAHCEYEKGFLIFDRFGSDKEVWRLLDHSDAIPTPSDSPTDADQLSAFASAEKKARKPSGASRGHFKPWALVRAPEQCGAFRFVYPTLASVSGSAVYLWDVRSGKLVQTIHDIQTPQGGSALGQVKYVELSAEYVFICGGTGFRVFERSRGVLVLRMSANPSPPRRAVALNLDVVRKGFHSRGDVVPVEASMCVSVPEVPEEEWLSGFVGVHVSASGKNFSVLLTDDRMVLVRDFERVIKGEVTLHEASLDVRFSWIGIPTPFGIEQSIYIAFDHGRVAAVTTSGIFIVTLDASRHGLLDPQHGKKTTLGLISNADSIPSDTSFPHLASVSLARFGDARDDLESVSCLQMTENKLFFTWSKYAMPQSPKPRDPVNIEPSSSTGSAFWQTGYRNPQYVETSSDEVDEWYDNPGFDDDEYAAGLVHSEIAALSLDGTPFPGDYGDDGDPAFDEDMDDQDDEFEDGEYVGDVYEMEDYGAYDTTDYISPVVCCIDFTPAV